MSWRKEFDAWCEREVASLRQQLEALESGRLKIGSKHLGGEWVDLTPTEIPRIKAEIESLSAIVEKHRREQP